ncbi:hypothetical protein V7S43_004597 [Phytophthora oleae]|uniref:Uncharacterized protein n=1 Tax=Phytophthora oleae TaxID=2107226 RepID=A0ABD3FX15_9STRA
MLLPILTSGLHVLDDGDLSFQCDLEPVASASDRHASKLIRKRLKRTYASDRKTSMYGNYAASKASTHTESRFGGSRVGGSRASASIRLMSKVHKMSLLFTASNNTWLPEGVNSSSPSSTGTSRMAVDFVELQRRTDIERDLSTRESVRRSKDNVSRKSGLRPKLRSLADPSVSLEKEEAMIASRGGKRPPPSRQGLSPLDGKRIDTKGLSPCALETATFRTEDYEGLASDLVLLHGGELLVGENCFVVQQRLRQELQLDLHTRGVIQPRIQLVKTPKPEENIPSGKHSPIITKPPSPLKQGLFSSASDFKDQLGSFDSTPTLALDMQAAPLAKGVALKLPDVSLNRTQAKNRNAPKKVPRKISIPENVSKAELNAATKASEAPEAKPSLGVSQSDSVLQTRKAPLSDAPPSALGSRSTEAPKLSSGSPVLPTHIHNGEKHLQSLRIRTPAYPSRLSRKTPSRSSMFIEGGEEGSWGVEGGDNLFSLHEQHFSTSSLPNVKYVREFPKPPTGRIQLFGSLTPENDWKLPTPSQFPVPPTVQHK